MPNVPDKTDSSLLDDFARLGDETAFAELVRRHQAMAFSTAYRICGDRAEAQDILQQALIVLARRAHELGDVRCLGAWLHRVVTLEANKARAKTEKRRQRETMAYQFNMPTPEERNASWRIGPELDRSLDSIGKKDREVITLHFLEGHTFKSIERQLGGTAEAWQKRCSRALQKLANRLRSRGVSVSAAGLGVYLASSRSEAGLLPAALETITRHAIAEGTRTTAGILGKTAILLTMKTGIAISLTSGVLLACGWGIVSRDTQPSSRHPSAQPASTELVSSPPGSRRPRDQGFSLQLVRQAVHDHDHAGVANPLAESRLRSLMFLAPESMLEDILEILLDTKDHARFQEIAAALFGCWAEYDPVAALARAGSAGDFAYQARRAVIVTWLNQDPEGALKVILAAKTKDDRDFLTEFVTYRCERSPREAALLVDRIASDWPEADRPLFELVAKSWSRSDPLAAGDWVASYPEDEVRRSLLKSMAVDVAKLRGFDGLAIASHIDDPQAKAKARNDAIYWWAVTTGGISLIPGEAKPPRDISGGFPGDWTDENIRTFAFSTMVNYSKNLPDLLRIAKDDPQRILIYEGAIRGSAWSNPAAVTQAAEQLPETFAATPEGKETLRTFIRRWNEMDSRAAGTWLAVQPEGAKTGIMREAIQPGGDK